ncbi:hypothetical protein F5888DRAFT_1682481 [Russula emetica]|nr:hypothetical protein F5888DRAFT_1682481 [Russula emetica]
MASGESDLTSDDTKRLWKTLERMLNTPPAPFAKSSGAAWTRFDHLCALVRDPTLSGGNSQTVERLRPLLVMIEEVERIRPPADGRAEGTGNVDNQTGPDASTDLETRQLGGSPIPGSSSRQIGTSDIERGGPVANFSPPFPDTIPLVEMAQPPPRGWTPTTRPGGSVEPDTSQLGVASIPGSSRQVEAWRPGVGSPMDPRLSPSVQASIRTARMGPFAPRGWTRRSPSDLDLARMSLKCHPLAFTPTYMPSSSDPRRAFPLDPANLPVQAHAQSVITDIPLPPSHMLTYPSPSSSSPGPFDEPQLGHVNQGAGRVPVVWTGGLQTPDPNSKAGTYLFLILQCLVAD